MNRDILQGSLRQWQGRMMSQWGDVAAGARMQRLGRMQKACGEARVAADRQMRAFESRHRAWQTKNV
jgi:uncharacterized protein YjbJ (UPF0337 family)